MPITADGRLFTIETGNTTYQMVVGELGHLLHCYYGKKCSGDLSYLVNYVDRGYSPNPEDSGMNRTISADTMYMEYSSFGNGDFRTPAIVVEKKDGTCALDLRYESYEIVGGKYGIDNLPYVYENDIDENAQTLIIHLKDKSMPVEVALYYGVFPELDIITRSVRVKNKTDGPIYVKKAASMSFDIPSSNLSLVHFRGRYGMERMMERCDLAQGDTVLSSRRGISSHQENPFFILCDKDTNEDAGSCYGFSLLYSGNFKNEIEPDPYNATRVCSGISDELFNWELKSGEVFMTPEAVMSFSSEGFSRLSENFHVITRRNICRGKYKESRRPVLINNWEATYFNFTSDKLVAIASQASKLGVELFVLDDGWFGNRNSDNTGLGDWYVNEEKLCGKLKNVADSVRNLGMKFGLWFEPEMVSEDSDFYRAHPDYAFAIPGRGLVRGRNQLVLDYSRQEVVDAVYSQVKKVLDETGVDYMKIDMNRSINEVYSHGRDDQYRGNTIHKYVLGMYSFLERLGRDYPDMLIEGCSGGGGRFDLGMLYYVPQIWCSDNTDAIERLQIQHGTSFGYPMSCVGAHVSAVPNHQTGRKTPIKTRGIVAMCGGFGYELDLNLLSEDEKQQVKEQIGIYKKDWKIIQQGRYYRLTNPYESGMNTRDVRPDTMAFEYVSRDKEKAIVAMVALSVQYNQPPTYIRLKGLLEDAQYEIVETGKRYSGSALMNAGIQSPVFSGCEYDSCLWHIEQV